MIFEGYDLLYNIIVPLLAKSAEAASRILIMGGVGFTGLSADSLLDWLSEVLLPEKPVTHTTRCQGSQIVPYNPVHAEKLSHEQRDEVLVV